MKEMCYVWAGHAKLHIMLQFEKLQPTLRVQIFILLRDALSLVIVIQFELIIYCAFDDLVFYCTKVVNM
jgi:hypothetical protein